MSTRQLARSMACMLLPLVLDFFEIHGKVILRNASIVIQNMLSITPESFNTINMVFGAFVHQGFLMTDAMMLAPSTQCGAFVAI